MGHPSLSGSSSSISMKSPASILLMILSGTGGRPGPIETAVDFTMGTPLVPASLVPSFEPDLISAM